MDAETRAKPLTDYLNKRKTALVNERSSFIPHYKELSEFFWPRRGRFTLSDRNRGEKRHQKIINSRGTMALRTASSGMLSGTMSPARPWFMLGTPDPDLMEYAPVRLWLHKVEVLMRAILNSSNFYSAAPTTLTEMLLFGTAAMTHVDDFEDVARFYTHTVGSYTIASNDRSVVDTIYREFEMSVGAMVKMFGIDKVSLAVKLHYDRGEYDPCYPVCHAIEPNPGGDSTRAGSSFKRYRSIYWEPGATGADSYKVLRKRGFEEFPGYVPRWDITGEDTYGTNCPGMTALGDVKGLQVMERRKAQAIDKMVSPPLKGPPELRNVPVSSLPSSLTLYSGDTTREGLQPIYQVQFPVNELRAEIKATEDRVNEAFYADLFLMLTNIDGIQPRNSIELMQRNEEKLLMLGPVLERLHGEWLDKVIDRLFNQMVRANILPPPPPELQNTTLKVTYISALAQAQRAVGTQAIDRMVGMIGGLMQFEPNAIDKLDVDQTIDEYSQMLGVIPKIIRSDDDAMKLRQDRAQQMAQDHALDMATKGANAAKMASDAKLDNDNVLTRTIGGGGQQQ